MSVSITSALRVALVSGTGVTFDAPLVSLVSTDDVYSPENPAITLTDLLNAISSTTLLGSATIDATTVGNTPIFTAPTNQKIIPTSILFALTAVSGSGNGPSINAGFTGTAYNDYIDSTDASRFVLSGGAFFAAGTGITIGEVLTFSGGTPISSDNATVTVSSASLVSLNLNAPGTIYVPGDTITLAGGVAITRGIVTVATVKLVSATIHASGGGTGYDGGSPTTFNVTVAGGTHSAAATVNVTTNGSGVVSTINSVTVAGSYTVLPTAMTSNIATGDDGTHHGTGLLLDLVFGINTFTITTMGEYTTETTTFTQFATTSAAGTGATFNTAVFGALGYTISGLGSYSVVPSNHITLTGGTGVNFDATWIDTAGMFADTNTLGQFIQVTDFGGSVYMTGGDRLFIRVSFASTFATYTLKAFVFGYAFT